MCSYWRHSFSHNALVETPGQLQEAVISISTQFPSSTIHLLPQYISQVTSPGAGGV